MALDLSKFKVPAGSLLVDTSLVVALVWSTSTMTQQLDQMNRRIDSIENGHIRSNADARIMVLERRAEEYDEFRRDMRAQLNRIEDKLDRLANAER